METLAQKYANEVAFVFIYCKEAHSSEAEPISTPRERLAQALRFAGQKNVKRKILIDDFGDQSIQKRYNACENSTFVLDRAGRVLLKQPISEPEKVEEFLRLYLAGKGRSED